MSGGIRSAIRGAASISGRGTCLSSGAPSGVIFFSQGPELFAATADGSTVRRIAQAWAYGGQSPHRESEPTVGSMIPFDVAPDGGQVAFATCRYPRPGAESSNLHVDYQYELALVPTQGGDVRRLTANETFDGYPAWSPDGRRIAFLRELTSKSDYGGAGELVTVAANGTDARRVVVGQDLNLHAPAWSPDGERLAFVANRQLYVVDADSPHVYDLGSGVLRPLAATISAPAWSPDGRRLVYAKDLGEHVGLYTIAPNGSAERRLGRVGVDRKSAWHHALWIRRLGVLVARRVQDSLHRSCHQLGCHARRDLRG